MNHRHINLKSQDKESFMKTAHSPTPWTSTKICQGPRGPGQPESCIGILSGQLSVAWINLNPSKGDKIEEGLADAARIVECVNACAGVEDPDGLFLALRNWAKAEGADYDPACKALREALGSP